MKERELEELFRDAARTAPPAAFDAADIAARSRRVTARRRMAATGGSLVAAAVLAVGIGAGTGMLPSEPQAGPSPRTTAQQPMPRTGGTDSGPSVLGLPGGGCGPDERLAKALATRLPHTSGNMPLAARECPTASRAASFRLVEGESKGRVTAIVSPVATVPPERREPGTSRMPDGTKLAVERANSGRVVMVRSDPDPGAQAPYGDRLSAIAGDLAKRF
ncbi:hypothetical protein FHX42_005068 [Saccharopolyspora lacisalsi]|uniref:Uncharacterized protein n=1 Tax=Halosaccharopolyspora lacisalsi TaxID=1000566 RepID=A0A839E2Z8_9PSEU|nr:hypothetical protein [Halosaccharopolyspora lacisalsi]MBA8827663.1 hypothetical protein [Halosaccharopolyspora lacisalsi]